MKKVLLGLSILVLAGCNNQLAKPQEQTEDQQMSEYDEMAKAVESGDPVKCLMNDTKNNTTLTYLMKAGKVKMVNMPVGEGAETASMLMDKEYIYNWSEQKKEGTKMKIPDETTAESSDDNTTQEIPDLTKEEQREAYKNQGYTISCEKANLADSEFMPPSDVTFTDMSVMMEQAQEAQKKQQESMTPEQRQQFEQMMQQYAQ